jgi:hypothetical protein
VLRKHESSRLKRSQAWLHGKTCENPEKYAESMWRCWGSGGLSTSDAIDNNEHEWAEMSMLGMVCVQGHEATRLRRPAGLLSRLTLRQAEVSHSHRTSSFAKRPTGCFPPNALHLKGNLSLVDAL